MSTSTNKPKTTVNKYKISGIYALACPDTLRVRYVGQSIDVYRRYKAHCSNTKRNLPVNRWCKKLKESGKNPELVILEETTNLDEEEIKWINKIGIKHLLNIHKGGKVCISETKRGKSTDNEDDILYIPEFKNPFLIFQQVMFPYRRTSAYEKSMKIWKRFKSKCTKDIDILYFQMWVCKEIQKLGKDSQIKEAEAWVKEAVRKSNKKHDVKITLVYNDGVEVTL